MGKKKAEKGQGFYVFTSWGLCYGAISEIVKCDRGKQYRLRIDIDDQNFGIDYEFYYTRQELYDSVPEAVAAIKAKFKNHGL